MSLVYIRLKANRDDGYERFLVDAASVDEAVSRLESLHPSANLRRRFDLGAVLPPVVGLTAAPVTPANWTVKLT